jgi:hypothetical protein
VHEEPMVLKCHYCGVISRASGCFCSAFRQPLFAKPKQRPQNPCVTGACPARSLGHSDVAVIMCAFIGVLF